MAVPISGPGGKTIHGRHKKTQGWLGGTEWLSVFDVKLWNGLVKKYATRNQKRAWLIEDGIGSSDDEMTHYFKKASFMKRGEDKEIVRLGEKRCKRIKPNV